MCQNFLTLNPKPLWWGQRCQPCEREKNPYDKNSEGDTEPQVQNPPFLAAGLLV